MNIIIGRGPLSDEITKNLDKNSFLKFTHFNFFSLIKKQQKNNYDIFILADSNSIAYCFYLIFIIFLFALKHKPRSVIYIGSISSCNLENKNLKEFKKYNGLDYYSLRKKIITYFFINLFKLSSAKIQVWHPGIILGNNQNWNKKLSEISKYKIVKLILKDNMSAPLTFIDTIIKKIKTNEKNFTNKELLIIDNIVSWEELITSFRPIQSSKIVYQYQKLDNSKKTKLKMIIKLFLKIIIFNTPIYYFYLNKNNLPNKKLTIFEFDYRTKELMNRILK